MNKNFKYLAFAIALPLLTLIVWLVWTFMIPAMKNHFLNSVSRRVEKMLPKERRSKKSALKKLKKVVRK